MTNSPRLIGLYSPAPRSGKTTVAEYLVGMEYRCIPFAGPLKSMLRVFLAQLGHGAKLDHYTEGAGKEELLPDLRITPRQLMQTLGTEWGRTCVHPQIWTMCWEHRATDHLENGLNVVVDDVRFPNEAAMVRRLGGEMWRIERPEVSRTTSHSSEGGLDDYQFFDRRIVNDGSLLTLHAQVRKIVAPLSLTA